MDEFCFVDPEICGVGGKTKKNPVRKRLSNITNKQSQTKLKSLSQDEKLRPYSFAAEEYIEKLQKENITLRQLVQDSTHDLQETNELLELMEPELTKLRTNIPKLEQQNRLLAHTNSQMTMERTLNKDRMRVMQHVLAAKDMDFQESEDVTVEATVTDGGAGDTSEEMNEEHVPDDYGDAKPNKSCRSRIQSSVMEQVVAKEKPKNKRKSDGVQSEQGEATAVISDNKRPCLWRETAWFNSDSVGPTKDFCEMEDARNPSSLLLDENMQDSALEVQVEPKEKTDKESDQVTGDHVQAHVGDNEAHKFYMRLQSRTQSLGSSDVNEQMPVKQNPQGKRLCPQRQSAGDDVFETEDARFPIGSLSDEGMQVVANSATEEVKEDDTRGLRTSSGRPLRRAAGKVQSYKEIPLNIKMRRTE